MKNLFLLVVVPVMFILTSCQNAEKTTEWQVLFDGSTLNGWKKAVENPESISIENGSIKCSGKRSHLFYEGEFKNFEFSAEIKTMEHSNSGIFIHTKYLEEGWPAQGYEIQVNNSYRGSEKNPERRKTGSIYNVRNVYFPVANDHEWFTIRIKVVENLVEVFVNDIKVNEYIQPNEPWRWQGGENVVLSQGTFALQAHDENSTTFYRNIKARHLPDGNKTQISDLGWDTTITKLMKFVFPFVDLHVH